MKQLILSLFLAATTAVMAQEKPLISSAVISLDTRQDIAEAKKYIDQAADIVNAKDASAQDPKQYPKFLYYQSLIYARIIASSDPEIKALAPNGAEVAKNSLLKLLEYEKGQPKAKYSAKGLEHTNLIVYGLKNVAFDANEGKKYVEAAEAFLNVYDFQKSDALGEKAVIDTLSLYYAGLSYNGAEMPEKAVPLLEDVLELGYNGYTFTAKNAASGELGGFSSKAEMDKQVELGIFTDPKVGPSQRPDILNSLLNAVLSAGDTVAFKKYLAQARKEYPNEISYINLELQGYIDAKDFDKALEILDVAITQEPDNALYYYVKGYVLQTNVKDNEQALAAYAKAIELDPKNFDAYFMSGIVWYDQGKAVNDEMSGLGMSSADQKKYNKLKVEREELFGKSLPFFEAAYQLNNEDLETVRALWEVYRQLKQNDKVLEMKARLDELTPKE